ncbi:hypothetical protein [Massilia putida]|uniref:hypothetical protein n=1 Tax=Massilia putida TaxID=1141883 RepID=UPI000950C6C0|nr:hypothetical protein [Massilia putida]
MTNSTTAAQPLDLDKLEALALAYTYENGDLVPWVPLDDDGDALRLAVKLSITLQNYGCGCIAVSIDGDVRCDEMNADDPYAATRRAIVLAAASIGEAQCRM